MKNKNLQPVPSQMEEPGNRIQQYLKGSCDSCLHCILPAKSCRKPYAKGLGAFCLISISNRDREQLRSKERQGGKLTRLKRLHKSSR